jgi:hypothetical protein
MRAYGELVQSVALSLNEFRDQNVTTNQARDHLVQRFPNTFRISTADGQPRVGVNPDAENGSLPNFRQELGLSEDVEDLDDETIEEKLVPAARTSLARSRQQLLATMVMMGINRIIVTDGKINAKLKFNFKADDSITQRRQATKNETQVGNRWATDAYQYTAQPVVFVTDQRDTTTTGNLDVTAALSGEVSLNFRSETFPLEKMVNTDQILRLKDAQGAGRGTPPAAAGPSAPTTGAAAPTPAAG